MEIEKRVEFSKVEQKENIFSQGKGQVKNREVELR